MDENNIFILKIQIVNSNSLRIKFFRGQLGLNNVVISIITVCYNSELTIEDTIVSVLKQKYINFEYIIIDGDSKDSTLNIIKKYEKEFVDRGICYYYISEKDKGIYDAMNKGISMAKGDIIGIINSDDWYEVDIFGRIVEEYKNNNKPDIIHGNLNIYSQNKTYIETIKPKANYKKLRQGMILKHPTFFVNRDVYKNIGCFNQKYKISADYDFVFRAYQNNYRFYYLNNSISNMRLGGVSNEYLFKSWKEVEVICYENGMSFINVKWYALIRYLKHFILELIKKRNK